jgi:predicted HTH transcriptional regulator
MTDFQNEMSRAVTGFVTQISELARRAALDTLESAFSTGPSRKAPAASTRSTAATAAATQSGRGRPPGRGGAKRSASELEALTQRFVDFVKSNPGLRVEQINKQLGTTTKDLALPIRKLVADGVISAKGEKRATTYIAGKKAKN